MHPSADKGKELAQGIVREMGATRKEGRGLDVARDDDGEGTVEKSDRGGGRGGGRAATKSMYKEHAGGQSRALVYSSLV